MDDRDEWWELESEKSEQTAPHDDDDDDDMVIKFLKQLYGFK